MLEMTAGQVFEATMLICFGTAWPPAIWKTWRTKQTGGKSLIFLVLVLIGYSAGTLSKFLRSAETGKPIEPIWMLYALNTFMVGVDLILVTRYRRAEAAKTMKQDSRM